MTGLVLILWVICGLFSFVIQLNVWGTDTYGKQMSALFSIFGPISLFISFFAYVAFAKEQAEVQDYFNKGSKVKPYNELLNPEYPDWFIKGKKYHVDD